jgi:hypothetical protein
MDSSAITKNKTALPMTMLNLTDVHVADACCLLVVRPPVNARNSKRHTAVLSGVPSEILSACFAKEMLGGKIFR